MAVKGKINVITKIAINNHVSELVNSFNYLGYAITVMSSRDLKIKLNRFNQMWHNTKKKWVRRQGEADKVLQSYGGTHTYIRIQNFDCKKKKQNLRTAELTFFRVGRPK
jgi:ABC-type cobalamin transport system ATPase subunit